MSAVLDDDDELELDGTLDEALKSAKQDGESIKAKNKENKQRADDEKVAAIDRTDQGNANLMIALAEGNLRYVPENRTWIIWDGEHWTNDTHGAIVHRKALLVANYYTDIANGIVRQLKGQKGLSDKEIENMKKRAAMYKAWAAQCRSKKLLDAMVALASRDKNAQISIELLDRDRWLLGVANGVVDLRTGSLRPDARDDFVTKRTPYRFDPNAKCPRWRQFIEEITGKPLPPEVDGDGVVDRSTVGRFEPRPKVATYVKRVLGYMATGSVLEQQIYVLIGHGSNGKNRCVDTYREVMGPYGAAVSTDLLTTSPREIKDANAPSPAIAALSGVRAAIGSEIKNGRRLDANEIKRHTGEESIPARFLHRNIFNLRISYKFLLLMNTLPRLDHIDEAIKSRIHVIAFLMRWNRPDQVNRDDSLPDADKNLSETLKGEMEGILAWVVEGAKEYAAHGLESPDEVTKVTGQFFERQDPIARWMKEYERCSTSNGTSASVLFDEFTKWKEESDAEGGPSNRNAFAEEMRRRNVAVHRDEKRGTKYGLRNKPRTAPAAPADPVADETDDMPMMAADDTPHSHQKHEF